MSRSPSFSQAVAYSDETHGELETSQMQEGLRPDGIFRHDDQVPASLCLYSVISIALNKEVVP